MFSAIGQAFYAIATNYFAVACAGFITVAATAITGVAVITHGPVVPMIQTVVECRTDESCSEIGIAVETRPVKAVPVVSETMASIVAMSIVVITVTVMVSVCIVMAI